MKFTAPLVKVKEKYQITLPASLTARVGVGVGDILEAEVQGKKITLTPRSLVDRELALAWEDVRRGRVHGPFRSAKQTIAFLHRSSKKSS